MSMKTFDAQIIKDSRSPEGVRLTSFVVTFPRAVLSEFNTHRMLSRNSASSRAIPVTKMVRQVADNPYVPERVGINRSGMQATDYYLPGSDEFNTFQEIYLAGRDQAVLTAAALLVGNDAASALRHQTFNDGTLDREALEVLLNEYSARVKAKNLLDTDLNVHKQHVNRVLEPYMWHTAIVTATDWWNMFALRDHEDADPAIARIGNLMRVAYEEATPTDLAEGEWHLPFILEDEEEAAKADPEFWSRVSAARCARVSYMTHYGYRDVEKDIFLGNTLETSGHMSPFEHPAVATNSTEHFGNFRGWKQARKFIENEGNYAMRRWADKMAAMDEVERW